MNIKPEWQTPPGGDFARYVEKLNANAAVHEAAERRRQAERHHQAQRLSQRRVAQPQGALQPQRSAAVPSVPAAEALPKPSAPAKAASVFGKVFIVFAVVSVVILLADTEDGGDIFGFFILAVIAWRIFFGGLCGN